MLPKEDRKAMLLRLYNEDTPLMDHSKDRFFKANARANDEDEGSAIVKDEEEEGRNAVVKDEDEEGEEDGDVVVDGGVVGDVENGTMDVDGDGDGDGDVEREMQDDAVADAVKAETVEEEDG